MRSKKLVTSILTALAAGSCWGGVAAANNLQTENIATSATVNTENTLDMKMPETPEPKQKNHNSSMKLKLSGHIQQSIEHHYNRNGHVSNWWAKEIYLNPEVEFPKSEGGWKFKAQFITKFGTDKDHGFNDERLMEEQLYNGGMARDEMMRPDQYYFEGSLGKTGQYVKIGDFQPWVQSGYVFGGNIQGISLEHRGNGYTTHFFAGQLDVSNGDLAIGVTANYDNAAGAWSPRASQPWKDNVRSHPDLYIINDARTDWQPRFSRDGITPLTESEQADLLANGGTGSDNALTSLDAFNSGRNTQKTVYAFVYDKKLSSRLDGSLGYYRYKSAAYNREPLHIGAATLNYKLSKGLQLQSIFAMGSQHGPNSHDKGFMIDLLYNGNPWIPADRAHYFGAYIGYHYLAPDTYIKCAYGDDVDKGQKGIAMGVFYNITKNVQLSLKYGVGRSLTDRHDSFREKFYSSISAYF